MPMTPETLKLIVESRLVQTFRQYPRAGLHLSSSCRNALIAAARDRTLFPEELKAKVLRASENDRWTLQARLAFMDIFAHYEQHFNPNSDAHNKSLLQAISDGILSAGGIPQGDAVPVRQLPESKAAE